MVFNETVTADNTGPAQIDPLHRIWVPREKRDADGHWVFQTSDGERYRRDAGTGVIRNAAPKVNGKLARKIRARLRKQR